MGLMKPSLLSILAAGVLASFATGLHAQTIGINFAGRQWSIGGNSPQTLLPDDFAGFVPQQYWNNVDPSGADSGGTAQITGPNAGVITDSTGNITVPWAFNYVAGGMWSVNQSTQTGDAQLTNGYLDTSDLGSVTLSFEGIDLSLYTVYVYFTADNNGRLGSVSNGASTVFFLTDTNPYLGLTQATATTSGEAFASNYAVFENLTSSSLEITLIEEGGSNVGIAGIQIVAVPEPATGCLLTAAAVCALGVLRRKSRA